MTSIQNVDGFLPRWLLRSENLTTELYKCAQCWTRHGAAGKNVNVRASWWVRHKRSHVRSAHKSNCRSIRAWRSMVRPDWLKRRVQSWIWLVDGCTCTNRPPNQWRRRRTREIQLNGQCSTFSSTHQTTMVHFAIVTQCMSYEFLRYVHTFKSNRLLNKFTSVFLDITCEIVRFSNNSIGFLNKNCLQN